MSELDHRNIEPLILKYRVASEQGAEIAYVYDAAESLNVLEARIGSAENAAVLFENAAALKTAQQSGGED
jgi:hypothetical protein